MIAEAPKQAAPAASPVTIKKYANRRLYNTASSTYVTLDYLAQMVRDGIDFAVYDAKTGEEITRSVLTQIIVEEEGKGQNLLPISFLRQLIGMYGGNMQWILPKYLEQSMQTFVKNQEQFRGYLQSTFGNMFPFSGAFEEIGKQNMAMIDQAMRMFMPSGFGGGVASGGGTPPTAGAGTPTPELVEQLEAQIALLRKQLEEQKRG